MVTRPPHTASRTSERTRLFNGTRPFRRVGELRIGVLVESGLSNRSRLLASRPWRSRILTIVLVKILTPCHPCQSKAAFPSKGMRQCQAMTGMGGRRDQAPVSRAGWLSFVPRPGPGLFRLGIRVRLPGQVRVELDENVPQDANARGRWVAIALDRAGQEGDEGELLVLREVGCRTSGGAG